MLCLYILYLCVFKIIFQFFLNKETHCVLLLRIKSPLRLKLGFIFMQRPCGSLSYYKQHCMGIKKKHFHLILYYFLHNLRFVMWYSQCFTQLFFIFLDCFGWQWCGLSKTIESVLNSHHLVTFTLLWIRSGQIEMWIWMENSPKEKIAKKKCAWTLFPVLKFCMKIFIKYQSI